MNKIVIILILICSALGFLLWKEINKAPPPILPPLVFEENFDSSELIKAKKNIAKVYALCKNKFFTSVPNYMMSWSATAHYTVDVRKIKISQENQLDGVKVIVNVPAIEILEGGHSLINETDFYTFKNKALIAKSESDWEDDVKKEKERAQGIAKYYAEYALVNDVQLKKQIVDSIKKDIYVIAAKTLSSGNVLDVVVNIADSKIKPIAPDSPSLCSEQPFSSFTSLNTLPNVKIVESD
ncbi:hypothetical protein [Pseudoalteromonas sp. ECSMB14103]|uniref:hypothetical protein n=1 Tax=Pseudoalteromonas sp. ECSMB14103 TaxID=1580062 RepID=UPI00057B6EE1|nr:hypothetical protein [Pseudoalteromonas sp. ECSMB14103]